eukprot:scaffold83451_cov56-Phaeocystis_antarctica.AAC.1
MLFAAAWRALRSSYQRGKAGWEKTPSLPLIVKAKAAPSLLNAVKLKVWLGSWVVFRLWRERELVRLHERCPCASGQRGSAGVLR